MQPSVSICVPTYNGAAHLVSCLESALNQTSTDFELLVVDDASSDDTVAITEAFAVRDRRVRVARNPRNIGLVGNWNRCLELAKGAWIKFLFQDDLLSPACLSTMLSHTRGGIPFVVTARQVAFEPDTPAEFREQFEGPDAKRLGDRSATWPVIVNPDWFVKKMLERPTDNWIGEPTSTLFHRSVFDRFGDFNSHMRVLVDWEFSARVAVNTGFAFVKEPLATFRVHAGSATQRESRRSRFTARLDNLVLYYELAYAPAFEPVRAAAARFVPAIDFRFVLARAVREARREARRSDAGEHARVDLQSLMSAVPRLTSTPRGYRRRRMREFRWAVQSRLEGLFARRV
jgi:glycosyltransferase involved in cell wall biosynthesis